MIYNLNLKLNITASEQSLDDLNTLESIDNFEDKLSFYNKNIDSLATNQFRVSYYNSQGITTKIFCNCSNCNEIYDVSQIEIFKRLREKEVNRLVSEINKLNTYEDKLKFLLSVKGFNIDNPLQIFDNKNEVINLIPKTDEDKSIFQKIALENFNNIYKPNGSFIKEYEGFNYEYEKNRLNECLSKSTDPYILIEYLINRIVKEYDYPNYGNNYNITKKANIDTNLWFHQLAIGLNPELDKEWINSTQVYNYNHVSEIFKYYKYLKNLQSKNIELPKCKSIDNQHSSIAPPINDTFNIKQLYFRAAKIPFSSKYDEFSKKENEYLYETGKRLIMCDDESEPIMCGLYDFAKIITLSDYKIFKNTFIEHAYEKFNIGTPLDAALIDTLSTNDTKDIITKAIQDVLDKIEFLSHNDLKKYFLTCVKSELNALVLKIKYFNPIAPIFFQKEWERLIGNPLASVSNKEKILFLTSNPSNTGRLQLDKEFRQVYQSLKEGSDVVDLEVEWAITPDDLQKVILKHRPTILHFSGHGDKSKKGKVSRTGSINKSKVIPAGIVLQEVSGQSRLVSGTALADLFSIIIKKFPINMVVLNVSHSQEQAQAIANAGVKYVVCMNTAVSDNTAIEFSTGLYRGIATEGGDYKFAFELARNNIQLLGLEGENTPVLYTNQ